MGARISPGLVLLVLAAAALHAGWNALIKARLEPLIAMTLVVIGSGLAAVPLLLAFGTAPWAAWPYVAGSTAIHLGYYLALAEAYRRGDMSRVYPLARGGAPLLTTLLAVVIAKETISTRSLAGVLMLGFGILLLSIGQGRDARRDRLAPVFALLTALVIAGYTMVDGLGARISGNPSAYAATLFVVDVVPMPLLLLIWRGPRAFAPMRFYLWQGLLGGAMAVVAYWAVIWAMTRASIPVVAALRETSVLFSAVIATAMLKERLLPSRVAAAVAIFAGIVVIELG